MVQKVGVVVPCFSHVDFLHENLTSLASQVRPPDRVLVVDDCSPRGSEIEHLCDYYKVEHIRHLKNKGLSEARNTGFTLLDDCEIIVSLDDDDMLAPGYIDIGAQALQEHPSAWVAYPDCQLFGWESRVWDQPDYDPKLLLQRNYIVCAAMWRRDAWDTVRRMNGYGYDPEMSHLGGYEDWLFNMEALLGCRRGDPGAAVHMGHQKYWFLYRRHKSGSMISSADENRPFIEKYMHDKLFALYGLAFRKEIRYGTR